jgi:hypothetical protein
MQWGVQITLAAALLLLILSGFLKRRMHGVY